jgi:RNA polymerase sigma-70 factor (ECF subfamily)
MIPAIEPFEASGIPLVRMPIVAESFLPLIQAARQHDTHAWNRLLKLHERALYVYIAKLVRSESAALDLAQETLTNAVRHIDGLRDDTKFASWLFSIAHQKCVQYWRRQRRDESVFTEDHEAFGPPPEAIEIDDPFTLLVRQERETAFFACVDQLPKPQRAVILLRALEDFSLQEIAEISLPPGNYTAQVSGLNNGTGVALCEIYEVQ